MSVRDALFDFLLRRADDALVLGHRLSEWCGRAPALEEDIALANLALDLIGHARLFYAVAGEIEGKGRDEDALAYHRDVLDYRNALLVEQPNGDFAVTIMRHLLFTAFAQPYYESLASSRDDRLAGIAAKVAKELTYHLRHAQTWTVRLGDGTDESHSRAQSALDDLFMYTGELFESDEIEQTLIAAGIAPDPETIRPRFKLTLERVFEDASLRAPSTSWMQSGGRRGHHSEHLGHLLAEMQFLQRAYPGASW